MELLVKSSRLVNLFFAASSAPVHDDCLQRLQPSTLADKQPRRKPAIFQQISKNNFMRAGVQPHAAQVLKPQISVSVDLGILQPGSEIRRPS